MTNVDNTSDADKPVSTATQTALDLKSPLADPTFTGTVSGIDKTMVGLTNLDNTSDADKPVSTATQTALDLKSPIADPTFTGTVSGIDKTMVGLTNVDNTSDADKPVSTATQTALDLKAPIADPTFTGTTTATTFSGDFNGTINTATTASTQSSGDSSTKVATTAFVTNAVAMVGGLQPGTATGQMNYWDGTAWVVVAPGTSLPGNQAQTFVFCNGVPTWGTCPAVVPTLSSTTSISSITGTAASSGGVISDDGGASVTARGVIWGTSEGPTISDSKTSDGTGAGTFISILKSLIPGTTYYVRAYATNSVGTTYGAEVSFTTTATAISVGTAYKGGTIAYILQSGDPGYVSGEYHGLIAAANDQTSAPWSPNTESTGATGTALGTGLANTNKIISTHGGTAGSYTYAAGICADYSVTEGGVKYDDWYLPSKDELNKMYINRNKIGGFATNFYWSSTGLDYDGAWVQDFSNGDQYYYGNGNYAGRVRAVRAF